MRLRKLLILSASVGGGHVAAANALLEEAQARGHEATHVDILKTLPRPTQALFRDAYFDLVARAPDLVNWVGDLTDKHPSETKPFFNQRMAHFSRLLLRQIPMLVRETKPDLLLHTHFVAPAVLSTQRPDMREAVIVTDYEAHNFWLQRGVGRYFVATEEMAVHLKASGIGGERVQVTGIPVSRAFGDLPDKRAAREALSLPLERDMLLLNASGLAKGVLVSLLTDLKTLRLPLRVVVVCGRSEEHLIVAKRETAEPTELVTFSVLGFTKDMPKLMAAADLLVGKPGGLTVSEALAAGLPFAVVSPYPVQEAANQRFLLESGAAFAVQPLSVFAFKVKRFFDDEPRRAAMQRAAASAGKADASAKILDSLAQSPLT